MIMKQTINWPKILYITGIVAFFAGTLDPLEGSVIIGLGCALMAYASFVAKNDHWKIFLISFIMVVVGVCFLFYFSSLGGFGGTSTLSWWWGLLMLPYPAGWILVVILLINRIAKKAKLPVKI